MAPDITWWGRAALGTAALTVVVSMLTGCGEQTVLSPAGTPGRAGAAVAATPETTTPGAAPTADRAASGGRAAAATPATDATSAASGAVLRALAALAVKGRAAKTGYQRDQFGSGWVDTDRNGCDTRNDILATQLTGVVMRGHCVVLSGTRSDPYTATDIRFVRGGARSLDIDHVVALSDAWQKGAATWPFAKRVAFANDPLNLLAVDARANRAKGDSDAASWLPPNKRYRCDYVARQVAVKTKYRLWVTTAEKAAIARVASTCPTLPLPRPGPAPTLATNTGPSPAPRSATPQPSRPAPLASTRAAAAVDPDYGTCKAAKAAGKGPYRDGVDPEYDFYRDADHDGIVCE